MVKKLEGWRYGVFMGGFLGLLSLTLYPIIIDPLFNTDKYKKIQEQTRKGIKQEDIQPGSMKVWSDPFDRKKAT